MPTQDSDDDFDVDAEIAKELAALHNEPSSLLQASAQTPAAEQSAVPDVQDSDGNHMVPVLMLTVPNMQCNPLQYIRRRQ